MSENKTTIELKTTVDFAQLQRDINYLLTAVAALNARIAAIDERDRLREARQMRGVR